MGTDPQSTDTAEYRVPIGQSTDGSNIQYTQIYMISLLVPQIVTGCQALTTVFKIQQNTLLFISKDVSEGLCLHEV